MSNSKGEKNSDVMAILGIESEVNNAPHQVGKFDRIIVDPALAKVNILARFGPHGIEWDVLTYLITAAYLNNNIKVDKNENKEGYSFLVGPAVEAAYKSEGFDKNRDFYAIVNVLGGSMDVTFYKNGYRFRFGIDLFGGFAMTRPVATQAFYDSGYSYKESHSVLDHEYQYSMGVTKRAKFELRKGAVSLGATLSQQDLDSINVESLERHPEENTNDLEVQDSRRNIQVYLAYDYSSRLSLKLLVEKSFKDGTIFGIDDPDILTHGKLKIEHYEMQFGYKL